MLLDLLETQSDVARDVDVAIVGAGIAGLVLADRLRKNGKRVVIVESGGREQAEPVHPLNEVEIADRPYRGATHSRFRCLGGTSTRWGGALIPFVASDLEGRPDLGISSWPMSLDALTPYVADVERLFCLDDSGYDESFLRSFGDRAIPSTDTDFTPRFAKWPRFALRNVATLLSEGIDRDPDLEVWLNANVTKLDIDRARGTARGLVATAPNGRTISVTARHVALCAGAIEATRLLLVADRDHDGRVFSSCDALGRYFQDHVSAVVGEIRAVDPEPINRLAGFRFHRGAMRSLRFELTPKAQAQDQVGSSFLHIAARPLGASGFDGLREFLRSVQRRKPEFSQLVRSSADSGYLLKAAYWRYVHKQLLWPHPAAYDATIVAEQLPQRDNQIRLSTAKDRYGIPRAVISWNVRDPERRTFAATMRRFSDYWARHALDACGRLDWRVAPDRLALSDLEDCDDIAHPMGSTRMGRDREQSVLNGDLSTHAVPNLFVASTSAFPSGSSANPTMMLVMLTLRLGDQLARQVH